MKTSGAPETGDLVVIKEAMAHVLRTDIVGLIINCSGVKCEILWPHRTEMMPDWIYRSDLCVIGDVNEAR